MQMARRQRVEQWGEYLCTLRNRRRCCLKLPACDPSGAPEIAPELTGHGLPLSKCEAYNRVYEQSCGSS